jgi:hypothetical protein
MIEITRHISNSEAAQLRAQIRSLDKAYWQDRSKHNLNLGVDNSVGQYYSCGQVSCPAELSELIESIAPECPGYELEEWIINWTPEGGFMPPHIDNEGYLRIGILCLQSDSGAFIWYRDNNLNQPERINDIAGQLIHIDDITQIHAVAPACMDRYVIIFLYR